MTAAHLGNATAQMAVGALEAQRLLESLRAGDLTTEHAWLTFAELAARHGWKSASCKAFVCELSKRAAVAR